MPNWNREVLDSERDYLDKEEEGECFTAAEIFRLMNKRNASVLRGISAKQLSFRLTAMGFKPKHTMRGNCYHVVQTEAA